MRSVANLMHEAAERLSEGNPEFSSYVDVVEDILRTNDVVTSKRLAVNGEYHRNIAAALVLAQESDQPFMLATRYHGALHQAGLSTTIVSILDKAVTAGRCRDDRRFQGSCDRLAYWPGRSLKSKYISRPQHMRRAWS